MASDEQKTGHTIRKKMSEELLKQLFTTERQLNDAVEQLNVYKQRSDEQQEAAAQEYDRRVEKILLEMKKERENGALSMKRKQEAERIIFWQEVAFYIVVLLCTIGLITIALAMIYFTNASLCFFNAIRIEYNATIYAVHIEYNATTYALCHH